MRPKVITTLVACALVASAAYGGSGRTEKKLRDRDLISQERADVPDVKYKPVSPPDPSTLSVVGSSTTLTGYWDFQINGGACEMIRINPATGNIHVIMMIAEDSTDATAQSLSRRTAYAMSTNNGASWNNFTNLRVPGRRSGYPFLDLGRGSIAGAVIIANHSVITTALQSTAFVDFPEGGGVFAEIGPPPLIEASGADEPVWPAMAGAFDGSIIMAPGRLTANTTHITRTTDFVTWAPWFQFPGSDQGSARNVTIANETGRVAVIQNSAGLSMIESTNSGVSWPATPFVVFPPIYVAGNDSFTVTNGEDGVYNGNNVLIALEATRTDTTVDGAAIFFWSAATGIQLAVPHDSRFISTLNLAQVFQSTLGYPVIGMSGGTIVVVFAAFQPEISAAGFNYSDLWWTASTNGGTTWTSAVNITNTPAVDERFPSISKWNPTGFATIVWQEKLNPGSSVRLEVPITRANQKFLRFSVLPSDVRGGGTIASGYKLGQNYPNPFNPSTVIDYTVPQAGHVTITAYNMLGKQVASLVSKNMQQGSYQAVFDGTGLPSGTYYYKMSARSFSETRKMLLIK